MEQLALAAIFGGIGGAIRGLVGLFKAMSARKKIVWHYFGITCVTAIVIGAFTGTIFSYSPQISLLTGYAGTDVLEGIYKTFNAQKVLVVRK